MALWIGLLAVLGVGNVLQLIALYRQRRLFLRDPQRRRFFLGYIRQRQPQSGAAPQRAGAAPAALQIQASAENAVPAVASARPQGAGAGAPTARAVDEAVVCVDASGECTFANRAARELLQWNAGNLALRDVLAGGRGESDALLESLARRGLVEQHPSTLAGPTPAALEISAVAVRDRDDKLWGAALFIRRAADVPAVVGPSHRASSRH